MKRIIIDTDVGVDDAMAILLALRSPELRLEALTSVFGNVDLAQTTRNCLKVLEVAGRTDIPVYRGCAQPLLGDYRGPAPVHGDDGLGNAGLSAPSGQPAAGHAVDFLRSAVTGAPGEITLIAIGPLTNVALALSLEPEMARALAGLVVMGGAVRERGNVTPAAEFNIHQDPEAASIVFAAGAPLVMVGLDVTRHVILNARELERLATRGNPLGEFIGKITPHYHGVHRTMQIEGITMHDSCAVAYAIDPTLFQVERLYVGVETRGTLTEGVTVADFRRQLGHPPNATVCLGADRERFVRLYLERLTAQ